MAITIALDSVFVESVALVAATREATDAVFAATMVAHVGECCTFIDIFSVDVTVPFGAELLESDRARFWARIASVTPCFTDTATTNALQVVSFQLFGTNSVSVVEVARLLALIDTTGSSLVECQTRRTSARERSLRVDANTTAFANARVQIAFVDVRARLAVHLSVADGAVALDRVTHFARASPCQPDGTTTFRFKGESREVVFAAAVNHFGPARSFTIICKYFVKL